MITFGYGGVTLVALDRQIALAARHWRNDPEIMRWCRQRLPVSDAEQDRWYEAQSKDPSIKMYLIEDADNTPAGVCGFTDIDPWNRRAEFSLYVRTGKQRRGIGENALKTLFTHGFRDMGLRLIWGETFDGNPAEDLFQALGMCCEGTRRGFYFKNDNVIDAHLYSLMEAEWRLLPWCWGSSRPSP